MTVLTRLLCALALAAILPATSLAHDDDDDAPRAGSVVATRITQDSARLTSVVWLGKGSATYWFEYGTSDAPGKLTSAGTATHKEDDDDHRVMVTRTLTGLPASAAHRVRLVVDGSGGRRNGAIATFTTAAAPALPGAAPPAAQAPQPPPAPELGRSVVVAAAHGTVRVRPRGSDAFVPLAAAVSIPVGSVVGARRGSVALRTARTAAGRVQKGRFGGSRFVVRQRRDGRGYVNLHLRGGGLSSCGDRGARALASAPAKRRKRVRSLWAKDRGGRFRTHGRDSVATVRGTRWTMTDRCDGTLTSVTKGAVAVKVRRSGRVVRLGAGERHLARHRP